MSRIITFSRTFPSYHPLKGEPTYFVEAILTQLGIDYTKHDYFVWLVENNPEIDEWFLDTFFNSLSENIAPKSHTIRSHKRPLKVGDFIDPKCWAGKPYNKTEDGYWQIKFTPDIQIKKVWDFSFRIGLLTDEESFLINGWRVFEKLEQLSINDGLSKSDFISWFNKPMKGQINCWNEKINY